MKRQTCSLVAVFALAVLCWGGAVASADQVGPDAIAKANRVVGLDAVTASWSMDPRDAVVLDPNRLMLGISGCAVGSHTDHAWTDQVAGHPRFNMGWPGRRHVWSSAGLIPIDVNTYPILVVTYRATHTHTQAFRFWDAIITLRTDTGLESKYNFVRADNPVTGTPMISDGQLREFRIDTRDVHVSPDHAVFASKTFKSLWVGVRAGAIAPATFELVGMRLESTDQTRPDQPFADEAPIRFRVTDSKGNPIEGAAVTLDAQRINFARSGQSDRFGEVSVTPMGNDTGQHTARVEKEGWMPTEFRDLRVGADGYATLALEKAVVYRGRVADERGAGIAGVSVRMYPATSSATAAAGGRSLTRVAVATGPDGRWTSPPMPASVGDLCLRLTHLDYVSDAAAKVKPGHNAEQLIRGYPVAVMRDGVRLSGQMHPAAGQKLSSVKTQLIINGRPRRLMSWVSGDGVFDLGVIERGTAQLLLTAKGHQDMVIEIGEDHDGTPLNVQMEE